MGRPNHAAQRLDAAAMAFRTRQAARCRPAPVAVHDDRHMQREPVRSGPSVAGAAAFDISEVRIQVLIG